MMHRIVWIGWAGLLLAALAGWSGYRADPGADILGTHLLLAVVAAQALAFTFLAAVGYLLLAGPVVRRHAGSLTEEWGPGLRRAAWQAAGWALLGLAPLAWQVFSGTAAYLGHASDEHRWLLWLLLPSEAAALWGVRRVLVAVETGLQDLRRRLAAA
jgi:hypothetical protein